MNFIDYLRVCRIDTIALNNTLVSSESMIPDKSL